MHSFLTEHFQKFQWDYFKEKQFQIGFSHLTRKFTTLFSYIFDDGGEFDNHEIIVLPASFFYAVLYIRSQYFNKSMVLSLFNFIGQQMSGLYLINLLNLYL